jgi:hypothetical protein
MLGDDLSVPRLSKSLGCSQDSVLGGEEIGFISRIIFFFQPLKSSGEPGSANIARGGFEHSKSSAKRYLSLERGLLCSTRPR